ncbi:MULTISPECIES: hypothetical protein [Asanoa]|uniref:Uncharacterized protein n=2 Tax=Asanoa TaxID=195964 RepID=A0A239PH31_9ACTN|nr:MULTISPECIES: hypothetical protein [Asanoa]GIF74224.1 hypothetical protein Asi02nite_37420 [Asanoa siamensis]SNT66260.1 hypothetical protein SAMN05421812_1367 [Asanoa hainanensis]
MTSDRLERGQPGRPTYEEEPTMTATQTTLAAKPRQRKGTKYSADVRQAVVATARLRATRNPHAAISETARELGVPLRRAKRWVTDAGGLDPDAYSAVRPPRPGNYLDPALTRCGLCHQPLAASADGAGRCVYICANRCRMIPGGALHQAVTDAILRHTPRLVTGYATLHGLHPIDAALDYAATTVFHRITVGARVSDLHLAWRIRIPAR